MKKFGRRHRPFFRICAIDKRRPRNGRVIEELGTYDPMVPEVDARAILKKERIQYWLGVGAEPSDKVSVLIKKYGEDGTHTEKQTAALERLAQSRRRPEPVVVRASAPAEAETPAEETKAEAPAAEAPAAEAPAADVTSDKTE